ncbi:MAG: chorismate pyruvate-lyase family protein [Bryobacteraceae bacterium]
MAFLRQLTQSIRMADLGMVQRVLLVTDGTLTDAVEALFGEPIGLRKLGSRIAPSDGDSGALEAAPGSGIMHREILLKGEATGRNYVYAESELMLDRLPEGFREGLLVTNTPMGRLWSEHRMETWKELLYAGPVEAGGLAVHFPGCTGGLIKRTYRIFCGGRPLMVISEFFPRDYGFDVA